MTAGAVRPVPPPGLFAPDGVAWRINREALVLAGGTCALLMQLAHPAVAAGVAEHSTFEADPFARLRRTLKASYAVAFGTGPRAERAIGRINAIHELVSGTVPESGDTYRATDPALVLWVHATLADTALRVYERFIAPLSRAEADAYHRETAAVVVRFGVPEGMIPDTLLGLRTWMAGRIASGEVRVSDTARTLLPRVLYPTPAPRLVWDAAHLVSLSVLPAELRHQYGIRWPARREAGVRRLAAVTRQVWPLLPVSLRHVPAARAAEARAAEARYSRI